MYTFDINSDFQHHINLDFRHFNMFRHYGKLSDLVEYISTVECLNVCRNYTFRLTTLIITTDNDSNIYYLYLYIYTISYILTCG